VSARDRALEAIRAGFDLPPRLTPSEWAEQNVILPDGSALPGPFRFSHTPYLTRISHDRGCIGAGNR
jgi:phage terminase large subunit GpA-like protein